MKSDNYKIYIEREHGEEDEVSFSFRYVDINHSQVKYLKIHLEEQDLDINQISKDSFIIVMPLSPKLNPEILQVLNKDLSLTDEKYGIWISFISEYDHAGFTLPDYVRKFYLKVGGQFDVSMINI